jgi:DNA-binding HxlR family transcriptional regulator
MIDIKDSLVKTLEENPDLYKIINSKDHVDVLEQICKQHTDLSNLKRNTYIKKDNILYNILETLIQKELVKKIDINDNIIYHITDVGEKLVNLYKNAKKEYNLQ